MKIRIILDSTDLKIKMMLEAVSDMEIEMLVETINMEREIMQGIVDTDMVVKIKNDYTAMNHEGNKF